MDASEAATKTTQQQKDVVLLTGSSGCLGFQTLKLLISQDDKTREIRCLDLKPLSKLMRQEIQHELEQQAARDNKCAKHVEFITGDIRDLNLLESIMNDLQVNCILHCAAKTDIWTERSQLNGSELESINVDGTENLLKCCMRFGINKFVHVSSYEMFASYHTIYYATENTIPEPTYLLFGVDGRSKKQAELKVKQYANNKLRPYKTVQDDHPAARRLKDGNDFLNAVILRFTPIYGENDQYFVTKYLQLAKHFSGTLQKFSNIWIRQQPIYVGNAAWALICAKNRMDIDSTIAGEEFHLTDDTPIGDPFEFLEPFLKAKEMRSSKTTLPGLPVWFMIYLFFWFKKLLRTLDVFSLFTKRRGRLEEAKERDRLLAQGGEMSVGDSDLKTSKQKTSRWYELITPQMFFFTCNSMFLNRTKANLRLDYNPLYTKEESMSRSIAWYRDHLKL